MFGLFYPETNERYMPFKEFATVEEAQEYMSQKNGFIKENPKGDDLLAWINTWTGDILVLRQLTKRVPDALHCSCGRTIEQHYPNCLSCGAANPAHR
jgi:hypothetical protein